MNRPAIETGLSVLDAGGDFTDGVIAYEGGWLGACVLRLDGHLCAAIAGLSRPLTVITTKSAEMANRLFWARHLPTT